MARRSRIFSILLVEDEDDSVGPVRGEVVVEFASDDATAVALGEKTTDRRAVVLPRAAFNALKNALRRRRDDAWDDGVVPHPIAKEDP